MNTKDYFCGQYFKCQSDSQTLAVIPAVHRVNGKESCSVQLITDKGSWEVHFPLGKFRTDGGRITIGNSYFGRSGLRLDLRTSQLNAEGTLIFGGLSPIKYDIMGPFRYAPFLECRHNVLSMRHSVSGAVNINGETYYFDDGAGYIEGDRGSSFPSEYLWTQCCFNGGSLMLSVAKIPVGRLNFTGIIGIIQLGGREYRLATYLGAKVLKNKNGEIVIRQGGEVLTVRLPNRAAQKLRAPCGGAMTRTIHESASCPAYYRFERNSRVIFELKTDRASFEYEFKR